MCGRKLKTILSLSVLLSLFSFSPYSTCLCAEVKLTDEEAQELMNEIQLSKEELENVKNQLTDVESTCKEQKIYYEKQLSEAEKENQKLKVAASAAGGSTAVLLVVTALLIIF